MDGETPTYSPYEEVDEVLAPDQQTDSHGLEGTQEPTPEEMDTYVGAQVNLPVDGEFRSATVKRRVHSETGQVIGTYIANPILVTRSYDVVFEDGREASYTANLIAESMYAQCDIDGNQHLLLKAIVDHTSNDQAVKDQNQYVVVNGRSHPRKTTAGWFLAVEWKGVSTSWEKLNELKESFSIEVAEYAVANGICDAPAFA